MLNKYDVARLRAHSGPRTARPHEKPRSRQWKQAQQEARQRIANKDLTARDGVHVRAATLERHRLGPDQLLIV